MQKFLISKSVALHDLDNNLSGVSSYRCKCHQFTYYENKHCRGILLGTKFANLPDSWCCPMCGCNKDEFIWVS